MSTATDGYYPLTEPRVVRELVRNRIKLDSAFAMKLYETNDPVISNGVPPFDEDIICVYIDLDRAIAESGLSKAQETVIAELMKGYGISDIAEFCFTEKVDPRTAFIHFARGVDKICKHVFDKNNEWAVKRITGGEAN